jgi:hypothetical protein
MSKKIVILGAFALFLLNACATAPHRTWDERSYGSDRKGQNTLVSDILVTPAEIGACDMEMNGQGTSANWTSVTAPVSPVEEVYQKLIAANPNDITAVSDARKLVDTALVIHRKSGISVVGTDTCSILKGEALTSYTRQVQKSEVHLEESGEFCATSFAGIAINDQVESLGRTPEGALMTVEKYEACGLGPPGIGQAAGNLEGTVENLRDAGRTELNPSEFRCSR